MVLLLPLCFPQVTSNTKRAKSVDLSARKMHVSKGLRWRWKRAANGKGMLWSQGLIAILLYAKQKYGTREECTRPQCAFSYGLPRN